MLIRLLRDFLRPYRRPLALVVLLQLVQTLATLYLPTLNADIIDNGRHHRQHRLHPAHRRDHAGRHAGPDRVRDRGGLLRRPHGDGLGRDLRQAVFSRVHGFSAREVGRFGTPSLITRTTNDVQQVQMLAMLTFTLMVSAPIMCVGGILLALNQDVELSSLLLVAVPLLAVIVALIISRMRPLFRLMQERIDEINQRAARADHRRPRDPGLRPRAARAGPLRHGQQRAARRLARDRPADGADVPVGHARAEPLQRRRAVVRRAPGGQRQRCRSAR